MRALLDSGANGTFIDPDTIDKYKLKKFPLQNLRTTYNADGTTQRKPCTHYTKIEITVNGVPMEIRPNIVKLNGYSVLLGMSWLMEHNPDIDWENGTLKWRFEDCDSINLIAAKYQGNHINVIL